ncbi:MAG: conjugal transfer protein TraF [Rickettsiales bacterium]|jgi:conjugal transfer pilus assembly protein TraF|nr:conjugal transfer protein TraF [Rickettsiales bacterium]
MAKLERIKKLIFKSLLMMILACNLVQKSEAYFYKEKARGWHWYEKKKEAKKEELKINEVGAKSASEQIEDIRKEAELRLHKAIVSPTFENIRKFRDATDKTMEMSEKFAYNFKRFIFTNPKYDPYIENPASSGALRIDRIQMNLAKKDKISELSKTHGLLYFFKGGCEYCREFSGVVKNFAAKYNWEVMAINLDGIGVPEFPDAKPDNGIADNLKIEAVPALVAVNPKDNSIVPLANGYLSESGIEDRVDFLIEGRKRNKQMR